MNDQEKKEKEKEKEEKRRVHITQQFRERGAIAYDFDCEGARLTVRVFETPADRDAWRVEARTSDAADSAVVAACGATRAAAFGELTRSWLETATTRGLPAFDWAAIGRAMTAVRAL